MEDVMPRWPKDLSPEEIEARKAVSKAKRKASAKAFRDRNIEKIRAKDRAVKAELFAQETPEQAEARKARMRAYQAANRDKLTAQKKEYYANNPEAAAALDAWKKEWNAENAEKMADAKKAWRDAHLEASKVRSRQYQKEHRKEISVRKLERYKTDVVYKISMVLRQRIRMAIKRGSKGGSAVRDLGCTIPEFIVWIESKFTEGMTWENWGQGEGKWHMDHRIPVSAFDLTDRDQFLAACHYSNLQPLWEFDNLSKGDKLPEPTEQPVTEPTTQQTTEPTR